MKNFKLSFACLAVFAMIFTSCSKDENLVEGRDGETATVSFATVLNDLVNSKAALKDHLSDFPACSDAAPSYVEVVLSGTESVGTAEDPLVISVSPNPGDYDDDGEDEYFTEESSELELTPGAYTLEHFVVYDDDDNVIWVAPMAGSALEAYVDVTLPISFDLGAGTKRYIDVEVLCYDDRDVNEYGYLFFDIETTEAIEFCIFGNFCPPSGRHYVAEYTVSVWSYEDDEIGTQLYTDVPNNVEINEDGDYAGDPLCFALPDTEGLDEYYFEITLQDSDAYGDIENRVIRAGVIDDNLVRTFFDGENNLDYYHFEEGNCGGEDTPIFPDPEDEAENYKACLYQLNDSGAIGFAYFRLQGTTLETTVLASGLETGMEHPQHIHGEEGLVSTCPDEDDDDNGDGLISLAEGLPDYGPVMVPLTLTPGGEEFPTAVGTGIIVYQQTFTVDPDMLDPLENRAVVLHGMTVEGEYWPTLPVACGTVSEVD